MLYEVKLLRKTTWQLAEHSITVTLDIKYLFHLENSKHVASLNLENLTVDIINFLPICNCKHAIVCQTLT